MFQKQQSLSHKGFEFIEPPIILLFIILLGISLLPLFSEKQACF